MTALSARPGPGAPPNDDQTADVEGRRRRLTDEPIYVILGVQGSGTNLLRRLLSKTFGFSVLKDRSLMVKAALELGASPDDARRERAIRTVRGLVFPSDLALRTRGDAIKNAEVFEGFAPYLTSDQMTDGASLMRLVSTYRAAVLGRPRMALKSDDLWQVVSRIDEVIPNRRVILLTRDFRDNLLSVGRKGWGPIDPFCAALWVKDRFQHYRREYDRSGGAALHAQFETLVGDPRSFFETFARHFHVTPTTDPEEVLESFPIRPNKVQRWRTALSPRQLSGCESILREELEAFGYSLASDHPRSPSLVEWAQARTRDLSKRVPQKLSNLAARQRT